MLLLFATGFVIFFTGFLISALGLVRAAPVMTWIGVSLVGVATVLTFAMGVIALAGGRRKRETHSNRSLSGSDARVVSDRFPRTSRLVAVVVVSALTTIAGFALGVLGHTEVATLAIWLGMFGVFAGMIAILVVAALRMGRR